MHPIKAPTHHLVGELVLRTTQLTIRRLIGRAAFVFLLSFTPAASSDAEIVLSFNGEQLGSDNFHTISSLDDGSPTTTWTTLTATGSFAGTDSSHSFTVRARSAGSASVDSASNVSFKGLSNNLSMSATEGWAPAGGAIDQFKGLVFDFDLSKMPPNTGLRLIAAEGINTTTVATKAKPQMQIIVAGQSTTNARRLSGRLPDIDLFDGDKLVFINSGNSDTTYRLQSLTFETFSTIPTPSAALATAIGLGGLAIRRRRR